MYTLFKSFIYLLIAFNVMNIINAFIVATDEVGVEDKYEISTIIKLKHNKATSSSQALLVGNTTVIKNVNTNESWSANVKVNNEVIDCPISKTLFESLVVGKEVTAIVYIGNNTGMTGCRGLK
jgi:hypothetical protein